MRAIEPVDPFGPHFHPRQAAARPPFHRTIGIRSGQIPTGPGQGLWGFRGMDAVHLRDGVAFAGDSGVDWADE